MYSQLLREIISLKNNVCGAFEQLLCTTVRIYIFNFNSVGLNLKHQWIRII